MISSRLSSALALAVMLKAEVRQMERLAGAQRVAA